MENTTNVTSSFAKQEVLDSEYLISLFNSLAEEDFIIIIPFHDNHRGTSHE